MCGCPFLFSTTSTMGDRIVIKNEEITIKDKIQLEKYTENSMVFVISQSCLYIGSPKLLWESIIQNEGTSL